MVTEIGFVSLLVAGLGALVAAAASDDGVKVSDRYKTTEQVRRQAEELLLARRAAHCAGERLRGIDVVRPIGHGNGITSTVPPAG